MPIASQLQLRRGTTPQHAVFTGAPGEVTVDTDKKTTVVHDGSTAGGFPLSRESVIATGSVTRRSISDRLAGMLSPRDFGAVGDGVTDDTAALQAFFSHIATNDVGAANASGTYLVSVGITFGSDDAVIATRNIYGNMTLNAGAAIDTMFTLNGFPQGTWSGTITVNGTGSTSYSSRTCRRGILVKRCRAGSLDVVQANNFSQHGVYVIATSPDNNNFLNMGRVSCVNIGSAHPGGSNLTANWSSPTNSGSGNSGGQRTTITVDTLPPTTVGPNGESPLAVRVRTYTGTGTYDPPSLAPNSSATTVITVTGAARGDIVSDLEFSNDLQGVQLSGVVTAANTVTVTFSNPSNATNTVNLASGIVTASIYKTHYVYTVDSVNSTLAVFPWIDSAITSGILQYVFGAGVYATGNNANVVGFDLINATRCSVGFWSDSNYGSSVSRLSTQACLVGMAVGGNPTNVHNNFVVGAYYCELNSLDFLRVSRVDTNGGVILSDYNMNLLAVDDTADARISATGGSAPFYGNNEGNFKSMALCRQGFWNSFARRGLNRTETSSSLTLWICNDEETSFAEKQVVYFKNSWTFNMPEPDYGVNRAFGYSTATVIMLGTGTNNSPTGSFVFAPTGTFSVNGSSYAITGDASTDVITATGSSFANGQIVRLMNLAGGAGLSGTTNYFIRDVSGDTFKVETSIGGGAVDFTSNITAGNVRTAAVFSGFTGPAIMHVYIDWANQNYLVVCPNLSYQGSATYNPPNLIDGAGDTTTVTVTGAALGDYAEASFSLDLQGIAITAWVSAADTVSVRFQNETGGTIDLGSGTLRARVFKP